MIFKVTYEKLGGHIHCRLFAAKAPNMTYAGCGDFVIREEELDDLERAMSGVAFEDRTKHQQAISQDNEGRPLPPHGSGP